MFTEVMIFAAFYAVAFVAHLVHGVFAKGAPDAERAHRLALYGAVLLKALHVAVHDYALHFADVAVHALAH